MDKPNMTNFFRSAGMAISKHSPEILMGVGIAGMITTTILAVKATPTAMRLIEEEKRRQNRELFGEHDTEDRIEKLKPIDVVKVSWKPYIPAAITGVTSVACLIGASSVHTRRNAALATAYKLSETALSEYKEKVIETIGERKEQTVREKVAKDRVKKYVDGNKEVYITEKGDTLFLDPVTKRQFKSDIELIRKAVNKLNYELTHDIMGYISLNEFYDEIGLVRTSIGDDLGWNLENGKGLLEVDFYPEMTEDGKPCLCLDYSVAPKYGFTNYYG